MMNRLALVLVAGVSALVLAPAAQAADLIIDAPTPVGVVDVSSDWEGPYVGVFAGHGWGTVSDPDDVYLFDDQEFDIDGWLLGATAGADFNVTDGIVAGVVGDIAWSDMGGFNDDYYNFAYDVNWIASLRGKLGFDGGAFLPYLTAGLAVANATADDEYFTDTQTHIGWTVGAGVEVAVSENLSVDLLYRYSDYGSKTYELDYDVDLGLATHQFTVGLNWRF